MLQACKLQTCAKYGSFYSASAWGFQQALIGSPQIQEQDPVNHNLDNTLPYIEEEQEG